jgi:hypothetical protein
MVKTTVYLDEADADAIRRLAAETGRSQAQIIREAVAAVAASAPPRRFHSMGVGRGDGTPVGRNAGEILLREWRRRRGR